MKSLHLITTHPATVRRAANERFLGGELSPAEPPLDAPWLVKAVLSGGPRLEITRDGVIPGRPTGLLPLRHGITSAGAPASCLLQMPGVERLRTRAAAAEIEVECAACRAWQATQGIAARRASTPVLARLWAALEPTPKRAA